MNPNLLTCYKPPFKKIRLGNNRDGGYVIADIPNKKYKTLLSGGISNDISFEIDFLNKYPGCLCFAYDGQINSLPFNYKDKKINFIKKNISNYETNTTTNLHDKIEKCSEIFIKMDIEGGEIPWLLGLNELQLNKFDQIVIEFHNPFSPTNVNIFNKLNKNHYLIHIHGNNCCGWTKQKGISLPKIFECTYLHKKYFLNKPDLNSDPLPGHLDFKNLSFKEELDLNYPPFVHNKNITNKTIRLTFK